jgi:hypothetical protein
VAGGEPGTTPVERDPGAVPDDADVRAGVDTDGDGHPDTVLAADGADLLVRTDLDGDALADRVLRIGPDATVHVVDLPSDGPGGTASWGDWLGDLFDPDG